MSDRLLLSCALRALLLAAVCAPAFAATQDAATTYKFTDGGVQFTVPAGWEAKPDKGAGAVKVAPTAGGDAQIAFVALPSELASADRAELVERLGGKAGVTDLKLGEFKGDETMGGMKVAVRPFEGRNNGRDVDGMFFLLDAEKPVFIVLVIDRERGKPLAEGAEAVINSVRKIE
ncbi:MAG TPA: hypothetical protein VF736_00625 [Pyrinomonadaceae bacterium]|jgi:hypothetical protein